jgi:hypothetical protein
MGFDPCNYFLKIWKSTGTPTPKVGAHLGVRFHSLAFTCTPESMKCDCRTSFLTRTFASPCLGHEPKARVATFSYHKACSKIYHELNLYRS